MHPVHHRVSRAAKARALEKKYRSVPTVVYTDAATYPIRRPKVEMVTTKTDLVVEGILPRASKQEAEELTTTLALLQTKANVIITDSHEVCRCVTSGWVAPVTHRIRSSKPPDRAAEVVGVRPCIIKR